MFGKILIANRGEIACRVIRTAHAMGIATVAVYSDADANSLHVAKADQAVNIGPAAAAQSYLCADKIITAALQTGAQAIHPGYGFLSENAQFVDEVTNAGLVFIGPSASAIRAMGLKDAAKTLMQKAGVPIVPGYHGDNQEEAFLAQQAEAIGYPVLIKARAGGGGKGMRKVEHASDFIAALQSAKREAGASFADDACLIEKYIQSPRHIEIQVFGDNHGNVVHLFERDCSLQRRHQKVIEEAPAPGMDDSMREVMGQAAVRAAQSIDYSGAGTVEFIVDGSNGLCADRFWFMEMNTRLQVEHPVTELITGQDLVQWQLLVASGEPLPCRQAQLEINGWAFEARVYAEDPRNSFLPASGQLNYLRFSERARVDTGVQENDVITAHYDPMIAKLVCHAGSREQALNDMALALRDTHIAGSVTNTEFLHALCCHSEFSVGQVDTGLIERDLASLLLHNATADSRQLALAALACVTLPAQPSRPLVNMEHNTSHYGFCLWQPLCWRIALQATVSMPTALLAHESTQNERVYLDVAVHDKDRFVVRVGDISHRIEVIDQAAGKYAIDDIRTTARLFRNAQHISVFDDAAWHFQIPDPLLSQSVDVHSADTLIAPMSGQIKLVNTHSQASVVAGEALVVMEAMKMEHTLLAPRDGQISELNVSVGDQVDEGAILIKLLTKASQPL